MRRVFTRENSYLHPPACDPGDLSLLPWSPCADAARNATSCRPELNADGAVDSRDFIAFLDDFVAGC